VSVTSLVTYAQCPKRFYWSDVDPLPRRRNPAAVRGSEIHRRIELHQRGQIPFEDMAIDLYDAVEDAVEDAAEDAVACLSAYDAYEASRFARERAALVEAPFTFQLEPEYRVRGRIDAIYIDGRHWEVVDFKSGRPKDDPSRIVQLEAYAVAVHDVDFSVPKPETLDVTFAYLGGGLEAVTSRADETWVTDARDHLQVLVDSIRAEEFNPRPGEWCRSCDFLQFCEPGRAEVS
jgi:predicted RecB family nuclease